MTIKQIQIKHPFFGEIIVHRELDERIYNLVGEKCDDYQKDPVYYYADIIEKENGMYHLLNFSVIRPEQITVGWMGKPGCTKNFITVFTNRSVGYDIFINLPSVLSIIHE